MIGALPAFAVFISEGSAGTFLHTFAVEVVVAFVADITRPFFLAFVAVGVGARFADSVDVYVAAFTVVVANE